MQELSAVRRRKLDESLQFQKFSADVDEESSWINEKQISMSSDELPDTLSAAQSLLKKHEAFQADLLEHQERVKTVVQQGNTIVSAGNYQSEEVLSCSRKLKALIESLSKTADARRIALDDSYKFLQFTREADSIDAWMGDKEPQAASDDYGKDLPSSQSLISKHDTFYASLVAFQPRVDSFKRLKSELLAQNNSNSTAVDAREAAVSVRWVKLLGASDQRKVCNNNLHVSFLFDILDVG